MSGAEKQQIQVVPTGERGFGRYELIYRFATGGMASIFLGRFPGPDGFEKLVAIKRIHEHLSSQAQFVAMFKDEARLAARISHPNVVQVMELGQCKGSHFIAMEYVEGESLTALLRRTRLPYAVAARIIADALAGLHAAHELRNAQGELLHLVHRDLSPSNILISYEGAVKVVDFGVARARGNLSTEAGTVKGKFAYMAPEHAKNLPLDRRSDLFCAGILLYETATHRRLFHAESEAATVAKVTACAIPPPGSGQTDFPPKLAAIITRALAKLPADRYQTAHEMQLALEEYIFASGAPVLPSTVGDLMRATFGDHILAKKQLLLGPLPPGATLTAELASSTGPSLASEIVPAAEIASERREREDSTLDLEPEDLEEVVPTVPPVPGMPALPAPTIPPAAAPGAPTAAFQAEGLSKAVRLDLQDLSRLPPRRTLLLVGGGALAVIAIAVTLALALGGRGGGASATSSSTRRSIDAGGHRSSGPAVAGARGADAPPVAASSRPDRGTPRPDPDLAPAVTPARPDARARAKPEPKPAVKQPKPAPKQPKAKQKKGLFGNPYED